MTKTKIIIIGLISTVIFIAPSVVSAQWNVSDVSGYLLPHGTIMGIIGGILSWLLAILGFIGIIGFVISGIMYLVSGGSDEAIKRAKKGMTASIIGVVVGLAGFVAIQAINSALEGMSGTQF